MVEFALIAPLLLLLVLGLLVLGIFVLNDVELSNGVRDGARAGAVCGSKLFDARNSNPTLTPSAVLPNGTACNYQNLVAYVQSRISTIPGVTPTITVDFSGQIYNDNTTCSPGQKIVVTAQYQQPLFIPLVGAFWGDPGNSAVRTISANAEATCEQ